MKRIVMRNRNAGRCPAAAFGRGLFAPAKRVFPLGHPSCWIGLALVVACDASDSRSQSSVSSDAWQPSPYIDVTAFGEAFEVVRSLTLEESDQAMVVQPRVIAVGGREEFLLTEPSEGQVNLYDTNGRLKRVFGRKGRGPGEFQLPLSARRNLEGHIVVVDLLLSRLTFLSPDGEGSPEMAASPVMGVLEAHDLGADRYLLAGVDPTHKPGRFLHIWNRETSELEKSFLPMRISEETRGIAQSFMGVSTVLEADTIWAVWSLSDTVYKFDRKGSRLAALPMVLPRPMGTLPGAEDAMISEPGAMQTLMDAITQISDLFVLENGDLVVQSFQSRGNDAVWDLLILDRQGEIRLSAANMPRLHVVDRDLFYFGDPATILPNRWLVARHRAVDPS